MTLEFNEVERDLLAEVLRRECDSMVDEVHHTDSFDYREQLKEKLEMLRQIKAKVDFLDAKTGV